MVLEAQVLQLEAGQSLRDLFETYYKVVERSERLRASVVIVRPPVECPLDPSLINDIAAGTSVKDRRYSFLVDALQDKWGGVCSGQGYTRAHIGIMEL